MRTRTGITMLLLCCLGILIPVTVHAGAPTGVQTAPNNTTDLGTSIGTSPVEGGPEALDSLLVRLTAADDPRTFADRHGLRYRNGTVDVVVVLESGASLPDGYNASIVASHNTTDERLVEAFVPVDRLRDLAREPVVRTVRPPKRAATAGTPAETMAGTQTTTEAPAMDWLLGRIAPTLVVITATVLAIRRWRGRDR